MTEDAPFMPGLSPVAGKPVHVAFDGGRMSSDAGVLVLAEIERRLGLADRLAKCLEDPRAEPYRVSRRRCRLVPTPPGRYSPGCRSSGLRPRPVGRGRGARGGYEPSQVSRGPRLLEGWGP